MCGIGAYIGYQPDYKHMQLQLLLNESRGGDGCGVYMNGTIVKDGTTKKKALDFLQTHLPFKKQKGVNVFITHNRKGSSGGVTTENAHPHESDGVVIVQNGTIKNIWELCTHHNIDTKTITNDTKALGLLLDHKDYNVLNEYKGSAALIWVKKDTPNTIFVFKGASKNFKHGEVIEERPLYYSYNKKERGLHFSSMEESLRIICPNVVPLKVVPNNVFEIKFEEGELSWKSIFKSDRGETEINIDYPTQTNYSRDFSKTKRPYGYEDCYGYCDEYDYYGKKYYGGEDVKTKKENEEKVSRYTYEYKKDNGFFSPDKIKDDFVSLKIDFVNTRYYVNNKLLHGVFNVSDEGWVEKNAFSDNTKVGFYAGVMLENYLDFNNLVDFLSREKSTIFMATPAFSLFMSNFSYGALMMSDVFDSLKQNYLIFYSKGKIIKSAELWFPFSTQTIDVRNYQTSYEKTTRYGEMRNFVSKEGEILYSCSNFSYLEEYRLTDSIYETVIKIAGKIENKLFKSESKMEIIKPTIINPTPPVSTVPSVPVFPPAIRKPIITEHKSTIALPPPLLPTGLTIGERIDILDSCLTSIDMFYDSVNPSEYVCIKLYLKSRYKESKTLSDIDKLILEEVITLIASQDMTTLREVFETTNHTIETFKNEAIKVTMGFYDKNDRSIYRTGLVAGFQFYNRYDKESLELLLEIAEEGEPLGIYLNIDPSEISALKESISTEDVVSEVQDKLLEISTLVTDLSEYLLENSENKAIKGSGIIGDIWAIETELKTIIENGETKKTTKERVDVQSK